MRTASGLPAAAVERFYLEEAPTRLVFIDGVYAPGLSRPARDGGVVVASLAGGLAAHAAAIEPHLGRHAEFDGNVFAALNTAFLQDGALILVPRDKTVAEPVHLLFVATQKAAASHPRCLVVAQAGSEITLVEDFVSLQDEAYFTNAVTEIALAEGARATHVRVAARRRPGIPHRELRGDPGGFQPLSIGLGRARRKHLALQPQRAAGGRRR